MEKIPVIKVTIEIDGEVKETMIGEAFVGAMVIGDSKDKENQGCKVEQAIVGGFSVKTTDVAIQALSKLASKLADNGVSMIQDMIFGKGRN